MFKYLKLWVSMMIELIKNKWFPSAMVIAEKEEKTPKLLSLDLQFFAGEDDDDDSGDDDDSDDDSDEDGPNIDELLKDPKFKKQYQAKLKEQLGKRMRK